MVRFYTPLPLSISYHGNKLCPSILKVIYNYILSLNKVLGYELQRVVSINFISNSKSLTLLLIPLFILPAFLLNMEYIVPSPGI